MLLSAVSVLVVAQLISEIPEALMNNPVLGCAVLRTSNICHKANIKIKFKNLIFYYVRFIIFYMVFFTIFLILYRSDDGLAIAPELVT